MEQEKILERWQEYISTLYDDARGGIPLISNDTKLSPITRTEIEYALKGMPMRKARLQTTQPTSGGAVTADKNCCANCVEPSRPQQWGPDLPFLGMPAMRTRWMAGAAAHKSG